MYVPHHLQLLTGKKFDFGQWKEWKATYKSLLCHSLKGPELKTAVSFIIRGYSNFVKKQRKIFCWDFFWHLEKILVSAARNNFMALCLDEAGEF